MYSESNSLTKSLDLLTDKGYRSQRERLLVLLIAFISYFVDAVWLFIYSAQEIVSFWIPVSYITVAVVANGIFFALIYTGWNQKFKDPNLAISQCLVGNMIQFAFLFFAPQVGLVFLFLIFVVTAFETLALTVRQFFSMWIFVAVSTGIIFINIGDKLGFPVIDQNQQIIAWLVFVSILARVIFINMQISTLRKKLSSRNQKLKLSLKQIEELANTDSLTQILNRRAFMEYAEDEMLRAHRNKSEFCIAIFDLDYFKLINDKFGHLIGDDVLIKTAEIVSETIRKTDKLARYGGEEFILLFPETSLTGCEIIMERIYDNLSLFDWENIYAGLEVNISTGIANFNFDENLKDITNRADKALYQAKHEGRNCMRISV